MGKDNQNKNPGQSADAKVGEKVGAKVGENADAKTGENADAKVGQSAGAKTDEKNGGGRILLYITLAATLIPLFLYILSPPFMESFDRLFYDMRFRMRQTVPDSSVVIVTVDEESIDRYGRWPWPRATLLKLLEAVTADEPAVVALDIVFSEKENADIDGRMVEFLKKNGNVVVSYFFRNESKGSRPLASTGSLPLASTGVHPPASMAAQPPASVDEADAPLHASLGAENNEGESFLKYSRYKVLKGDTKSKLIPSFNNPEVNIAAIQEAVARSGYFNFFPDPDGVYRTVPLVASYGGDYYPPLSIQAMQAALDEDAVLWLDSGGVRGVYLGGRSIPVGMDGSVRLNFYGPGGTIQSYSAAGVMDAKIPNGTFKDKIVFIGVTEMGIADLRSCPTDATLPGVELHATFVSNFIKNEFISRSVWASVFEVAFMLITSLFLIYLSKVRGRLIWEATALLLVIYLAVDYYVFVRLLTPLYTVYPLVSLLLGAATGQAYRTVVIQRKARFVKKAFGSYLAPELVEIISKNPEILQLGGQKREITCMFSDIRGFTSISEILQPTELITVLNESLGPCTDIILRHRGMLDKYMGDAIMALFNVPLDVDRHTDRAVAAACEMVLGLHALNDSWKDRKWPRIDIGIGINRGDAVVGNMGTKARFDYTAIGDAVNLASRLEGLNKMYGTRIIISEFAKAALTDTFQMLPLDYVKVKGKKEPIMIYGVFPEGDEMYEALHLNDAFEATLKKYYARGFQEALEEFQRLDAAYHCKLLEVYIERCFEFIVTPPPEGWDGVTTMTTK
jgi:adenylate cyclase